MLIIFVYIEFFSFELLCSHTYLLLYDSRRALTTDKYLRVKGAEASIFAIGDCSTIEQKQMVAEVRVVNTGCNQWHRQIGCLM